MFRPSASRGRGDHAGSSGRPHPLALCHAGGGAVQRNAIPRPLDSEPFRHEALLYPDADAYTSVTTRFILDGLAKEEPAMVAVPAANGARIRAALGTHAAQIRFVDITRAGANPNRIIPWLLRAFIDEHPDRPVRVVGESIWPGRPDDEVTLALQHEALINRAFAGRAATILCPFDATRLNSSVLAFANRTHPMIRDSDDVRPCADYVDPDVVVASLNNPLPAAGDVAAEFVFHPANLTDLRNLVARHASHAGMARDRIADLRLAVNEVATNTILHGHGTGAVRIWYEEDRIVCEIKGPGGIDDTLAGRRFPAEKEAGGRGLLVANNLCDLVETYTTPQTTTTRLHMRY